MIEILIDDKVVKINPKLTVGKYQRIQNNPTSFKTPTEILSLYLDIEPNELKDLPVEQVRFVEGILSQHMLKPKTNSLIITFELNGVTYGLENDWQKMTWGQWVDLEVYSQPDKINDHIHKILAILYRPVEVENGKTYKLKKFKASEVDDRAELFQQEVGIEIWFGLTTFFLRALKEFTTNTETSLRLRMKMEKLLSPMTRILPQWLHPKVRYVSTLNSPFSWLTKTLRK
jgi:hypothetical protein